MADLKNNIFNNNIAGDTSNILVPDTSAIKNGIEFKSNINSNVLNGYYNLLSEAIQFLQFTGGLYSEEANYNEGNIASLVIKNGEDYSIWQFRRNANNPQVLNNNPPIAGASITTVNSVDAYEGGTLNTDWDKLTEDYAVEATPNTVMGRDGEGASNVNMPSSIENTTVVNNQYLNQKLSTKQNNLIAGTNITIKNNVISASGNLATKAELVSFDNSNAQLQQLLGYTFPKFSVEIPVYNLVLTDGITDFNATISKQGDGSYLLSSVLANFKITNSSIVDIQIKSVNGLSSSEGIYALTSILSQFFELGNIKNPNYIDSNSEINIQDRTNFQIAFAIGQGGGPGDSKYVLKIKSSSALSTVSSRITLNIKNRLLRPTSTNIFSIVMDFNSVTNIKLTQVNSSVVYKSTYNGYSAALNSIYFYSDLDMSNYFNLSPDYETFTNTTGITSSSGKAVKFLVKLIGSNIYALVLAYQDDSKIQDNDVFTFNLTPDKNSTLSPIYKDVTNVQQLGEVLSQKDTELLNKINGLKAANIKIDTISGLNASNVQQAAAALNQKIYNIYDTSRKVPINDYALINNEKYNFYRVFCVKEVELIEDGKEHMLAVKYDTVNRANIVRHSITLVGVQKTICFSGSCSAANGFDFRTNIYSGELQLYYTIYFAQSFYKIIFFIDYY